MVVGTVERGEDWVGACRLPLAEPRWQNVSLPRPDRAALSFSGCMISHHACQLYLDQTLELVLWRRRLTGFVIAYPLCRGDQIVVDAVLVDNLAEASLFIEDICAFPPALEPLVQPTLTVLLSVHRQAHFNDRFSALAGQALADWALLPHEVSASHTKGKGPK